jgi:tRNA(fMet)-specific endonuclease VapC
LSTYLLDTNMASYAIRGNPASVRERLVALPVHEVAISAVTQGELIYGAAKRGNPALSAIVHEFLIRVEVLPWTGEVANVYGALRASCEQQGINLGALDMMIAAHAVATNTMLVTRDGAFRHVGHGLKWDNWAN